MNLSTVLQRQHQRLEALLSLLAQERLLLSAGTVDGDALAMTATQKQHTLAELEAGERERRGLCRQMGQEDHPTGDDEAAREEDCLDLWHAVRNQAHKAAQANRMNGSLIQARMASNQQLLNELHALIGKNMYGPDGQTRGSHIRLSSSA